MNHLKAALAQGKLEHVISELMDFSQKYRTPVDDQIILVSSRFNNIQREKRKGQIDFETYSREINAIVNAAYHLITELQEWYPKRLKEKNSVTIIEQICQFQKEFEAADSINFTPTRLRIKNTAARNIAIILQGNPGIISQLLPNPSSAIICGICKKIQFNPEFGDLELIELFLQQPIGLFTKGNMVNAIGEMIYIQKLLIGEDDRVLHILSGLKQTTDEPLLKNIDRVETALRFLLNEN